MVSRSNPAVSKAAEGGVMNTEEAKIQRGLITQREILKRRFPELALLHAITNDIKRGGEAGKIQGRNNKLLGVVPGIPDLSLPVSRGGYHGLYTETKTPTGSLLPSQEHIIPLLREQGYRVEICRSVQEGVDIWMDYLRGRK